MGLPVLHAVHGGRERSEGPRSAESDIYGGIYSDIQGGA